METGNWGEAFWQRRKDGDNANKKVIKKEHVAKKRGLMEWNDFNLTIEKSEENKVKKFPPVMNCEISYH